MTLHELHEHFLSCLGEASRNEEPATIAELYGISNDSGSSIVEATTVADILMCFASIDEENEELLDEAGDLLNLITAHGGESDTWLIGWLGRAISLARELTLIA